MKKKCPAFWAFALSACWIIQILLTQQVIAQPSPGGPDSGENEEPAFFVAYHVLPNVAGSTENYAYAINEEGKIAGDTVLPPLGAKVGAVWFPTETEEGYSPTYAEGTAYDINDNGVVAPGAQYSFDYEVPTNDENVMENKGGSGLAINNKKQVVGGAYHLVTTTKWKRSGQDGETTLVSTKYETNAFPAEIKTLEVDALQPSRAVLTRIIYYTNGKEPLMELPAPGKNGLAWSIDEEGYCVGLDGGGTAVWKYGGSSRTLPRGAIKRLISISKKGVVCGISNEGPTIWPKHGEDSAIVLPLPEDAKNKDHFATAASDTGWVVGQVGGHIDLKVDKKWGGGSAYAWKQEGVDENKKPIWSMVNLSKGAPKGWKNLTIFDVNRSGKAVGFAEVNKKYCAVMIELSPQLMAIDANRDGMTVFEDDPKVLNNIKLSDLTTPTKPFRFWLNDDEDRAPNNEHIPASEVNFIDDEINGVRDLEDFYRIYVRIPPDWEKKIKSGYKLKIESKDGVEINVFRADFFDEYAQETDYLTKEKSAKKEVKDSRLKIIKFGDLGKALRKRDYENKSALFLWEAKRKSKGALELSLYNLEGKVEISSKIYLDLHPVEEFFEHTEVVSEQVFIPPYMSDGFVPNLSYNILHEDRVQKLSEEESKNAVVFVHGWRMPDNEAINWGQIMYKRLWHAGYKGKYFFFRWPTYSSDESSAAGFFTYNKSEHRAWESGKILANYLKSIRSKIPSDYSLGLGAHSMGNIVAGEAVKLNAPVDSYVMMQAAVSASSYDERSILKDKNLKLAEIIYGKTPQASEELGYVGYFKNNKVPLYNFHNKFDFAMTLYLGDQAGFKADPAEIRGGGTYAFIGKIPGIYLLGHRARLLREIRNPYESMAFLARSLTKAVGGEPRTLHDGSAASGGYGQLKQSVDLNSLFGLAGDKADHSGQFNRSIQQKMVPFYSKLKDSLVNRDSSP